MATYTNGTTSATDPFGSRKNVNSPAGYDTFITTRFFGRIDLTGSGLVLADIASATLDFVVTATVGGGLTDVTLYWDITAGWGTGTLAADYTTFISTIETLVEHNISWTSTGAKSITIDKNLLNLNGNNWFRLSSGTLEGSASTKNVTIGTQNNATVANRPVLTITTTTGAVLQYSLAPNIIKFGRQSSEDKIIIPFSNSVSIVNKFYGVTGDGYVRETESVITGDPYSPPGG